MRALRQSATLVALHSMSLELAKTALEPERSLRPTQRLQSATELQERRDFYYPPTGYFNASNLDYCKGGGFNGR
jgi:hypothetical protein